MLGLAVDRLTGTAECQRVVCFAVVVDVAPVVVFAVAEGRAAGAAEVMAGKAGFAVVGPVDVVIAGSWSAAWVGSGGRA